jgi:hypothetical protein
MQSEVKLRPPRDLESSIVFQLEGLPSVRVSWNLLNLIRLTIQTRPMLTLHGPCMKPILTKRNATRFLITVDLVPHAESTEGASPTFCTVYDYFLFFN